MLQLHPSMIKKFIAYYGGHHLIIIIVQTYLKALNL